MIDLTKYQDYPHPFEIHPTDVFPIDIHPETVGNVAAFESHGDQQEEIPEPDALNFTMPNGGTITLVKTGSPQTVTLEYSVDAGATWTTWAEDGNGNRAITLQAGETVYVRNTGDVVNDFCDSTYDYHHFTFSATTEAHGNCNSLLYKTTDNVVMIGGAFRQLFLHAGNLVTAPELPSTTIAESCYQDMFRDCPDLVQAPVLPATYVPYYGYYRMFADCTSLNYVKTYMTSLYASSSITNWLRDVAATGDFYCDPSLNIPLNSGSGIPSGWTRHDL